MESQSNYSGPTRQSPTANYESHQDTPEPLHKFSRNTLEAIRNHHKLNRKTPDLILMALAIFDGRVKSISRREGFKMRGEAPHERKQ